MINKSYDIAVVGAGIIGGAIAYKLSNKGKYRIAVIDKEEGPSKHQTGRNSGVIHSGVYYPEGSLKSENCLNGYKQLVQFLKKYDLPFKITGKLIAATDETEYRELERLFNNAKKVGLDVDYVDRKEIQEIDSNITVDRGFFVKETGITDYSKVLNKLLSISSSEGVDFYFGKNIKGIKDNQGIYRLKDERGEDFINAKFIINCAGLQCDRVFELLTGKKSPVKILPFKGEYFELPKDLYKSDIPIYPVPNPDFPFLGVHLTRMIDDKLKVGPNAVLSFDREGYDGFEIDIADTFDIISNKGIYNLLKNYRATVFKELLRQKSKSFFEKRVKQYWSSFTIAKINGYSCGIRAQATEEGELLSDFRIETFERQVHILNAPSPAATSCLAIADTIISKLKEITN